MDILENQSADDERLYQSFPSYGNKADRSNNRMGGMENKEIILTVLGIIFLCIKLFSSINNRKWVREITSSHTENMGKIITTIGDMKNHFDSESRARAAEIEIIKDNTAIIREMVTKTDNDGAPLVFVPRYWLKTQKDISEICKQTLLTQEKVLLIIERIDSRQEQRRRAYRPVINNEV